MLDLGYRRSPDQDRSLAAHHPVIIVGAGPVGLSLAIDLRLHGIETVVLEADTGLATGSRAICYAKRSLEILDRFGIGQRMLDKGVTWQLGKVFWRDRMVYQFDLLPEAGHRMPAFVNLQQFYLEQFLVERAQELGGIDVRWGHPVTHVEPHADGAGLTIGTPEGEYHLTCDWLLACDGARSTVRRALDLPFEGQVFRDRFLITDVRMDADFPAERWFWFDPPFHPGQSALLHKQADNVWRIDLQLGWDADPEAEVQPERVIPRLKAMLGPKRRFEIEWISIYTFRCRRLGRFRHGRVIFLGDAAHQVSPFGARGFNGGIQDAENLAWKLALVRQGRAPEALVETFAEERQPAADENIRHSTRSTEFITPKNEASHAFRDAVLQLAEHHDFARRMINSGRLSTAMVLAGSSLNTADAKAFGAGLPPGSPCADAPVTRSGQPAWLLNQLGGDFTLVLFLDHPSRLTAEQARVLTGLEHERVPIRPRLVIPGTAQAPAQQGGTPCFGDPEGLAQRRYDAKPGTVYLIRPDQHVAGRWRRFAFEAIRTATRVAIAAVEPAAAMAVAGE